MKPARVGGALYQLGPLRCPRCQRISHQETFGIATLICQGTKCRQHWTAIRLPPGTTGAQLAQAIGEPAARALLRHAGDSALQTVVVGGDPGVAQYVQRAADAPEPPMGWHRARVILSSLYPSTVPQPP